MSRFLHISVSVNPEKKDRLKTFMDEHATDWLRYNSTSWIVWTEKSMDDWFALLLPFMDKDNTDTSDRLLILELHTLAGRGFQSPKVWDWLNKERK